MHVQTHGLAHSSFHLLYVHLLVHIMAIAHTTPNLITEALPWAGSPHNCHIQTHKGPKQFAVNATCAQCQQKSH